MSTPRTNRSKPRDRSARTLPTPQSEGLDVK